MCDEDHTSKKRIVVAGSFDILHPGHLFLLKEAARLGDVYVIVARDSSIKKVKGKPPVIPEQQRLEVIQAIKYVYEAALGNEGPDFLAKPLSFKPDIILLGPNQKISVEQLQTELKKRHEEHILVQRLPELYTRCPLNSSTAIKEAVKKQKCP